MINRIIFIINLHIRPQIAADQTKMMQDQMNGPSIAPNADASKAFTVNITLNYYVLNTAFLNLMHINYFRLNGKNWRFAITIGHCRTLSRN